MRVTIKEVAKEAGVSIATVSRVINGRGGINPETIRKVKKVIEELKYTPDLIARTMISKETRTIGFMVSKFSNEYWGLLSEAVQEELWKLGYSLFLCSTDHDLEKEKAFMKMFMERKVDGIIYGGSALRVSGGDDAEHIELIKKNRVPILTFDSGVSGLNCITGEHMQGAADAVQHLINLGHKKIAYIGGPAVSVERELGYRKALMTNHIEINERLLKIGISQYFTFGQQAVKELLDEKEEFTAIFCGNDLIALGAINILGKYGRSVPGDVAVVGFDDINMASLMKPELTTVRQPIQEMSKSAVDLLMEMIKDPEIILTPKKILFNMELMVRESCGAKMNA